MKLYFAPMEGITGYLFRNAFHEFFSGADKYYTPFLSPKQTGCLKSKELQDILPEHNQGIILVPQILTNHADAFIHIAKELKGYGYEEVNLNLGCPSGTVVAKKKGAGFLSEPKQLEQFLEEIFAKQETKISIKTRIGKDSPEEFEELLEIYNKFPLCELIIHPRIQKDQYNNQPNLEVFRSAVDKCIFPVCYNGDICTVLDYQNVIERFPEIHAVMIGRGIVSNPGLFGEIRAESPITKDQLMCFHKTLCEEYQKVMSGDKNVLFKMKEIWYYLSYLFPDSEKVFKRIKKINTMRDYLAATHEIINLYNIEGDL